MFSSALANSSRPALRWHLLVSIDQKVVEMRFWSAAGVSRV